MRMRHEVCRWWLASLILVPAVCARGVADDAKSAAGDNAVLATDDKQVPEGLDHAQMAARLAAEGDKRKSPILLLAAAEILAHTRESERDDGDVKASGTAVLPFTLDGLLARAEELAKGDETLSQLVKQRAEQLRSRGLIWSQGKDLETIEVEGRPFKGLGPGVVLIEAGGWHEWSNVIFEAKKPAIVVVVGDGDGDLDLFVYDDNTDGLIGKDTDASSVCVVEWTPRYEGPFKIRVENVGKIAENSVVLVNW